jgi:outer membrane protein TolC
MTLRNATSIALDNSEIVRLIFAGPSGLPIDGCFGPPLPKPEPPIVDGVKVDKSYFVIARRDADASIWRFKADVMALVRSVEQQYWNLAQAHVALRAADRAVNMAKDVVQRENAELFRHGCRGTNIADIADAVERLEQFSLDLVARTSDVITAERQLRYILGLPPIDNRRIIPVTPAIEQQIVFDWETCVGEMMKKQPDIVQQQARARVAELQLLLARNQFLPELSLNTLRQLKGLGQRLDSTEAVVTGRLLRALQSVIAEKDRLAGSDGDPEDDGSFINWQAALTYQMPMGRSPLSNTRGAQYTLLRSRAYQRQVVDQTTHSLARFFLEIDANYDQYRTSKRLTDAAAKSLEAQQAYYDLGRITADRLLDAVRQYATAVATESRYVATYNISLAALSEAKGTLLADRDVVVAEKRRTHPSCHAACDKKDDQAKLASLEPPKSAPEAKSQPSDAKRRSWTSSISIGGDKPTQIKGTISVDCGPLSGR